MSAFDNLFAMRSYESIGSDHRFVEFFSPNILDAIKASSLKNKVTIFRSGPGGGKTSLLQLFGPGPLRSICGNRNINREVHARLKDLGALTNEGPSVLSVYHRLDSYAALPNTSQVDGDDGQTLFALVGARLIMKWLANILTLKDLRHDQMARIKIGIPKSGKTLPGSPIPCNGKELYEWAARVEAAICGAEDGLDGRAVARVPKSTGLNHIHMMVPGHVTVDDEEITTMPLIALDDLHRLSDKQRRMVIEHVCEERYPAPMWIAERLDVLTLQDFFRGINGREYNVIHLEDHWEGRDAAFESFARSVSEKRTQKMGVGFKITSLPIHLDDGAVSRLNDVASHALKIIQSRVRARSKQSSKYDAWILNAEQSDAHAPADLLFLWKTLEIMILRDEKKALSRTPDDTPPPAVDWNGDKKTREAGELMLSNEFGFPYYYGFKKIASLATFNIELFLEISSEMMDRIVAQLLRNPRDYRISAPAQEKIVKAIAKRHWDDIERNNSNGGDVKQFLESLCEYAHSENTPSAPYAPGVTGFGMTDTTWTEIKNGRSGDRRRLASVIHTCLAQNYLKIKTGKQGRGNGDSKMVLYLNRLLCANAGLPAGRGGWRQISTNELVMWLNGSNGGRN